jgi:hypothetical protein
MDDDAGKKLSAKRFNEHVKLVATTINVIALGIFGAGVLQPLVAPAPSAVASPALNAAWIAVSVALHLLAHGAIRLMKAE